MTINNPDGSIYQTSGELNVFSNSFQPDKDYIDSVLQQLFEIAGSPISVYEIFINFSTVDKLYNEARDKIWDQTGKTLHALYEPIPSTYSQMNGMIDFVGDYVLEVSRAEVLDVFGDEQIKIGSRIFLPFLKENLIVVAAKNSMIQYWNIFGIQLVCQKIQYSETDNSMLQSANARTTTNYTID